MIRCPKKRRLDGLEGFIPVVACCVMRADISSPMTATTRERSWPTSGIGIFRIRRAIPPWHRLRLRISARSDRRSPKRPAIGLRSM
jgi:hypothetical protein